MKQCKQTHTISQEVSKQSTKYFVQLCSILSNSSKIILNEILSWHNSCKSIEISQIRLAKKAGVSRQTANKIIQQFIEAGIITSEYRHMRTSIYTVNYNFTNYWIRKSLSQFFPALGKYYVTLPVLLICALINNAPQRITTPELTQLDLNKNYIINLNYEEKLRRQTNDINIQKGKSMNKPNPFGVIGNDTNSLQRDKQRPSVQFQSSTIIQAPPFKPFGHLSREENYKRWHDWEQKYRKIYEQRNKYPTSIVDGYKKTYMELLQKMGPPSYSQT